MYSTAVWSCRYTPFLDCLLIYDVLATWKVKKNVYLCEDVKKSGNIGAGADISVIWFWRFRFWSRKHPRRGWTLWRWDYSAENVQVLCPGLHESRGKGMNVISAVDYDWQVWGKDRHALSFFKGRVKERRRKQNRGLGEPLNTANEAVIQRELFLT